MLATPASRHFWQTIVSLVLGAVVSIATAWIMRQSLPVAPPSPPVSISAPVDLAPAPLPPPDTDTDAAQ